jgi:hypothetical protein
LKFIQNYKYSITNISLQTETPNKMGYDISILCPEDYSEYKSQTEDNSNEEASLPCGKKNLYISYNHKDTLTKYGVYPRDLNEMTVRDILSKLYNAILSMVSDGIEVDKEILTYEFKDVWIAEGRRQNIDENLRIANRYYEDKPSVTLAILIRIRNDLEKCDMTDIWISN